MDIFQLMDIPRMDSREYQTESGADVGKLLSSQTLALGPFGPHGEQTGFYA